MINNKIVLGIVTEYDPFHNGHLKQIELAKQRCEADFVCVVMSGPFMQRGTLSMFSPHCRAKIALECGVDAVFELPVLFSLRDAYGFALGGISILDELGFIDYLSFGCEDDNLPLMTQIADVLEHKDQTLFQHIKLGLNNGKPFVQAQTTAIEMALGKEAANVFKKPNNVLGINYLRAINKRKADMKVITIVREGGHNNKKINTASPSASFIRHAIRSGNIKEAMMCLPYNSQKIVREELMEYRLNEQSFNQEIIFHKLKSMNQSELKTYPGISEGFENKILKALSASSINELFENIKSRRYTLARIRRLMSYIALDVRKETLQNNVFPTYTRLLGYRRESSDIINACNNSRITVLKNSLMNTECDIAYDKRAYLLWGTGLNYCTQKIIKI